MSLISNNVLKVASWEFSRGIKTPMFLILTFMVPILMSLGGLGGYLSERYFAPEEVDLQIGILDESGHLYPYFEQYGGNITNVHIQEYTGTKESITDNIGELGLDGVVVVDEEAMSSGIVTYYTLNTQSNTDLLQWSLSGPINMFRLEQRGIDPAEVMEATSGIQVVPQAIVPETPGEERVEVQKGDPWRDMNSVDSVVPIIVSLILLMATLFSGQMLMYGVIKEKRNRIVEILLSSMSSTELLLGKILGFGALSLAQISIWVIAGLIIGSRFWDLTQLIPSPEIWIPSIIYFIFGYFLLASIFAATGASMKEAEEGSQAHGLIILIPMAPLFFSTFIMMAPDVFWVRVLSHIPPFIPAMVLLRMSFTEMPWWEYGSTLLALLLSIYMFVRLGAKVFQEGILQYDRNLSLRDIKNIIKR